MPGSVWGFFLQRPQPPYRPRSGRKLIRPAQNRGGKTSANVPGVTPAPPDYINGSAWDSGGLPIWAMPKWRW